MRNIPTLEALSEEAAAFVAGLVPANEGATLVSLSGELGAGKTAFVQAIARALGVRETVNSPTFVLEKIYEPPKLGHRMSKFRRLVHIDAYRLDSGADLSALGLGELMCDAGNLILVEWPERISDALPAPAVRISLEAQADGTRVIRYG